MSQTKKLTALCTDMGAANSVIPVLQALKGTYALTVLVDGAGKAIDSFKKTYISFTTIGKDTQLSLDCDILLTGTTPPQYKDGKLVHYGREAEAWRLAREKRVQSITLLDKYNHSEHRGRFTLQPEGTTLQFPDFILAPNAYSVRETQKDFHAMPGYDKTRLELTGNPAFDDIPGRKQQAHRHYAQKIVPVFMSSQNFMKQSGMDNHKLLDIVCDAARGKAHLVVKAHPKDEKEIGAYQSKLEQYKCGKINGTLNSEELALSLGHEEFCVGTSGTLIEYATLGDVLALSLKPGWKGEDDVITNIMGVTPFSYTEGEAASLVQRALDEPSFRDEWKQNRVDYRTDGRATERVVELIKKL